MTWKPISTAPKDGTWIIAKVAGCFTPGRSYVPAMVAWCDFREHWTQGEGFHYDPTNTWDLALWTDLPPSETGAPYCKLYD